MTITSNDFLTDIDEFDIADRIAVFFISDGLCVWKRGTDLLAILILILLLIFIKILKYLNKYNNNNNNNNIFKRKNIKIKIY